METIEIERRKRILLDGLDSLYKAIIHADEIADGAWTVNNEIEDDPHFDEMKCKRTTGWQNLHLTMRWFTKPSWMKRTRPGD